MRLQLTPPEMDGFAIATTAAAASATSASALSVNGTTRLPSIWLTRRRTRSLSFRQKSKFLVFAAKQAPEFDEWEKMEFKFGRMIGEDPRLTLAKIKARRLDPGVSYLEIEKSFNKKKGKADYEVEEIPLDWAKPSDGERARSSVEGLNMVRPSGGRQATSSVDGLKLVRPVPKKGVKFESSNKPNALEAKKPGLPVRRPVESAKRSAPNVILRKPTVYSEDNDEEEPSRLRLKPNLSLKMSNQQSTERFTDMTLLKKPEPLSVNENIDEKQELSGGAKPVDKSDMTLLRKPAPTGVNQYIDKKQELSSSAKAKSVDDLELKMRGEETKRKVSDFALLKKPEAVRLPSNPDTKHEQTEVPEGQFNDDIEQSGLPGTFESSDMENATTSEFERFLGAINDLFLKQVKMDSDSDIGVQQLEQGNIGSTEEETFSSELPTTSSVDSDSSMKFSPEAALQGKPNRLDQSVRKTSESTRADTDFVYPESYRSGVGVELENSLAPSPLKELEDTYWTWAEELMKSKQWEEMELISSSIRGFVVSFGPLVGYLPYKHLPVRGKFLSFETWLRRKGLDPSTYRQDLGIIGSLGIANTNLSPEVDEKIEGEISPDMELKDLLRIFDLEKIKFLSSFVGQTPRLRVLLADRKSRKLIFSWKPRESDELIEKKRSLMAKLRIGDVVQCRILKIAYFGIFVEVEGVRALIHQTEVSWDSTLDPSSYFKIGQILEAKVYQLNFELERIFLSLKEMTSDPLSEALESVIGDQNPLDGGFRLQAVEADTEWPDVELLIKELQQIEGVQSVSKGRFFLSPGLAPTFQVYMASMFENQYKLLARSGNKVQEVIVQASLDKEEMKAAISACTDRVE